MALSHIRCFYYKHAEVIQIFHATQSGHKHTLCWNPLKWAYESCQFVSSFGRGDFFLMLLIFHFEMTSVFSVRLWNQARPAPNEPFWSIWKAVFWEFPSAKNLKMSHFIPVWTEARFWTLQILCEIKFVFFTIPKLIFFKDYRMA